LERRRRRKALHHLLQPPDRSPSASIQPYSQAPVEAQVQTGYVRRHEAPESAAAGGEARHHRTPHRQPRRLHDAAGKLPTRSYAIYKPGTEVPPTSRCQSSRRRRRSPRFAGERGGSTGTPKNRLATVAEERRTKASGCGGLVLSKLRGFLGTNSVKIMTITHPNFAFMELLASISYVVLRVLLFCKRTNHLEYIY
jgi:hypothetical protein